MFIEFSLFIRLPSWCWLTGGMLASVAIPEVWLLVSTPRTVPATGAEPLTLAAAFSSSSLVISYYNYYQSHILFAYLSNHLYTLGLWLIVANPSWTWASDLILLLVLTQVAALVNFACTSLLFVIDLDSAWASFAVPFLEGRVRLGVVSYCDLLSVDVFVDHTCVVRLTNLFFVNNLLPLYTRVKAFDQLFICQSINWDVLSRTSVRVR